MGGRRAGCPPAVEGAPEGGCGGHTGVSPHKPRAGAHHTTALSCWPRQPWGLWPWQGASFGVPVCVSALAAGRSTPRFPGLRTPRFPSLSAALVSGQGSWPCPLGTEGPVPGPASPGSRDVAVCRCVLGAGPCDRSRPAPPCRAPCCLSWARAGAAHPGAQEVSPPAASQAGSGGQHSGLSLRKASKGLGVCGGSPCPCRTRRLRPGGRGMPRALRDGAPSWPGWLLPGAFPSPTLHWPHGASPHVSGRPHPHPSEVCPPSHSPGGPGSAPAVRVGVGRREARGGVGTAPGGGSQEAAFPEWQHQEALQVLGSVLGGREGTLLIALWLW